MAELFHVSPDMSEVAIAAGTSLPEFTLDPSDLPSPFGIIHFSVPYGSTTDSTGRDAPLRTMMWGVHPPSRYAPHGDVTVVFYSTTADLVDLPLSPHAAAPFAHDNEVSVRFGGEWTVGDTWATRDPDSYENYLAILIAAWVLMQQPITSVAAAEFGRHERKRMARQGVDPRVRVVTLRSAKQQHDPGLVDSRHYDHRWIVRGHWRKQWYPSQDRHIPIWIAPHVKGPDGAPLLGGEKVYSWTR